MPWLLDKVYYKKVHGVLQHRLTPKPNYFGKPTSIPQISDRGLNIASSARGVFRDLARAILKSIVADQKEDPGDEGETRTSKRQKISESTLPTTNGAHQQQLSPDTVDQPLNLHILYIDDGESIGPTLDLNVASCPDYRSLAMTVQEHIPEQHSKRLFTIQAHLSSGLQRIQYPEDWAGAIESTQQTKWMENRLKIIVNMGEA